MSPDTEQALGTIGCSCLPIVGFVAFWCVVGYAVLHFVFKFW